MRVDSFSTYRLTPQMALVAARLKPGTQNSSRCSLWVAGNNVLGPLPADFPAAFAGRGRRSKADPGHKLPTLLGVA